MNKIYTLLTALLFTTVGAIAQSNTMVMIEEGTQASCGPCAAQNPAFDALLEVNDDKVVVLKYQTSWPGFDQMNLDNPAEVQARVNYYAFNGVPTAFMNGALWANDCGAWEGAPACLDQSEIDATYDEVSALTMVISGEVVNGELLVTGTITADSDLSGDLKLRIAITEQVIEYDDVPGGSNGETEYFNVLKKFIGGPAGMSLDDMTAGDVYTIEESFALSSLTIYDFSQLGIVGFVQDDTDKTVHQAAKDNDVEITVDAANNATAGDITGTPGVLCEGSQTLSPVFTIVNGGNDVLTSADIVYSANGGASQTYAWTGSLETFASEDVTVDAITFNQGADASVLDFMVENPNGQLDEVDTDDSSSLSIEPAPGTNVEVTVIIDTDNYGDETYWEIRSGAGDIIETGGNPNVGLTNIGTGIFPPPADPASYGNATNYEIVVSLPVGVDCYTFHITDYYGDGFLGIGGYSVTDNLGNEMHNNDDAFLVEAMKNFGGDGAVGLAEQTLDDVISVYPNPSSDVLNVSYNIETSEIITFDLINALGAKVATRTVASSGANTIVLDVSNLNSGVYQLNTTAGNAFGSTMVSIVR